MRNLNVSLTPSILSWGYRGDVYEKAEDVTDSLYFGLGIQPTFTSTTTLTKQLFRTHHGTTAAASLGCRLHHLGDMVALHEQDHRGWLYCGNVQ